MIEILVRFGKLFCTLVLVSLAGQAICAGATPMPEAKFVLRLGAGTERDQVRLDLGVPELGKPAPPEPGDLEQEHADPVWVGRVIVSAIGDFWVKDGGTVKLFRANQGGALAMYWSVPGGVSEFAPAGDEGIFAVHKPSSFDAMGGGRRLSRFSAKGELLWSVGSGEIAELIGRDPAYEGWRPAFGGLARIGGVLSNGAVVVESPVENPDLPVAGGIAVRELGVVVSATGRLERVLPAFRVAPEGDSVYQYEPEEGPAAAVLRIVYDAEGVSAAVDAVSVPSAEQIGAGGLRESLAGRGQLMGNHLMIVNGFAQRENPYVYDVFSTPKAFDWLIMVFTRAGEWVETWRFPFSLFAGEMSAFVGQDDNVYYMQADPQGINIYSLGPIGSLAAAVKARGGDPKEAVFQLTNDSPLPTR